MEKGTIGRDGSFFFLALFGCRVVCFFFFFSPGNFRRGCSIILFYFNFHLFLFFLIIIIFLLLLLFQYTYTAVHTDLPLFWGSSGEGVQTNRQSNGGFISYFPHLPRLTLKFFRQGSVCEGAVIRSGARSPLARRCRFPTKRIRNSSITLAQAGTQDTHTHHTHRGHNRVHAARSLNYTPLLGSYVQLIKCG